MSSDEPRGSIDNPTATSPTADAKRPSMDADNPGPTSPTEGNPVPPGRNSADARRGSNNPGATTDSPGQIRKSGDQRRSTGNAGPTSPTSDKPVGQPPTVDGPGGERRGSDNPRLSDSPDLGVFVLAMSIEYDGSGSFSSGYTDGSSQGPGTAVKHGNDVYYLIPRTVTIVYGPYFYDGLIDYRTERLQGLKTCLEKHGATVVMKQNLDHVNFVRVWFLDELIFSCKLTELAHGGDGELDPLCTEATDAMENFIKTVLRSLRDAQPIGPEELKRPFCPCFHVGENNEENPVSVYRKASPCRRCCAKQ